MAGSRWINSSQLSSSNCHTPKIFMLKVENGINHKAMPYYPKVLTVVRKQDIISKTVPEDYMYIDM